MSYPSSLDSISTVSSGALITSSGQNSVVNAVNAIESTLGTNPQGSASTVKDNIAAKAAQTDVQNNALIYAADSGSANAYAVTLSPAPAAYTAGMAVVFKTSNANTSASTLNVNSLGTKTIKKLGSTNLVSGDIVSSQIVAVVYDGTNFQLVSAPSTATGSLSADDLPWLIDVDVFMTPASSVGTWPSTGPTNLGVEAVYNSCMFNQATHAINDEIDFNVVLAAGTWTVEVMYYKQYSMGIITLKIDGTSIGTIDAYAGGPSADNRSAITGVTVATTEKHTLALVIASKNASSTDYYCGLQHIQLRRTA